MKHKFCINGKKSGIVGSAISNFWSYLLFVFVVIVFFVFFHIQEREIRENFIGSLESEMNIDIVALNYLRTPINFGTQSIAATSDRNFADFIQELEALAYPGPGHQFQDAIRPKIDSERLVGYKRLMIFLDRGGCLYDSRNDECRFRQPSYFHIPEGIVFLPVPVRPNDIQIIEVVFQ